MLTIVIQKLRNQQINQKKSLLSIPDPKVVILNEDKCKAFIKAGKTEENI
jgi:hypothetical protein